VQNRPSKGVFMKIFKGFLVVLYAFIVLGSVQTYSATYGGEVFSLAGIIDNFLVPAVLPLIIYGVVLLVRRLINKQK
jgi:hypothetical protein